MELETYKGINARCKNLAKDVEGFRSSILIAKEELEELELLYKTKLSNITNDKEQYINNKISERVLEVTGSLNIELNSLEEQLSKEMCTEVPDYTTEISKFYSDYLEMVGKYKKTLYDKKTKYKDILRIIRVDKTSSMHTSGIDALCSELNKGISILENNEIEKYRERTKGLVGKFGLTVKKIKRIQQSYRLALCLSLSFIVIILVLVNPLTVLVPMGIVSSIYTQNSIKSNKSLLKILRNIRYYDQTVKLLESNIKNSIKKSVDIKVSKFNENKNEEIRQLEDKIQSLKTCIINETDKATTSVQAESQGEQYEEKQKYEIATEYERLIKESKDRVRDLEQENSTNEEEYSELLKQRETGKKELEEQYFNLTECGKLKILPDKFLLGFDDYDIITLDMLNYNANIVVTTSKAEDVYVSFINMCITQLLCTMNPSCIKIYIVDILHGTGRFGLFGSLEEQGIVQIVDTEDELDEVINTLYSLKSARDKSIRRHSDNITMYNSKMIENYGITLDYRVLISTHHVESLIHNPLYIKLLDAGSSGIAVIGLWDKRLFEYEKDKGIEYTNEVCKFLEIISNSSDLSDVGNTNMSTMTSDGIIMPMKKQETEAKRKGILVQSNKDRR